MPGLDPGSSDIRTLITDGQASPVGSTGVVTDLPATRVLSVEEHTAQQVGAKLVVRFVAPDLTTEDLPLRIGEVDLRVSAGGAWNPEYAIKTHAAVV